MKKSSVALIVSSLLLLSGGLVLAQTEFEAPEVEPISAIVTITNIAFTFLIALAILFLIIAGFYFVTASGNPEQIGKARNMVLWAIVGVVIALLAKGLVYFICDVIAPGAC